MKEKRVLSVILAVLLAFTSLFSGGIVFTGDMGEVLAAPVRNDHYLGEAKTAAQIKTQMVTSGSAAGVTVATGTATWTVAIYLCGTDLESEGASGALDIMEMLDAHIDTTKVNVIVLTGGTYEWSGVSHLTGEDAAIVDTYYSQFYHQGFSTLKGKYTEPDDRGTQIWKINDNNMTLLYEDPNECNLSKPETVRTFFQVAQMYAPAENFMASFWDHGGGPLGGAECAQNSDASSPGGFYTESGISVEDIALALHQARTAANTYNNTNGKKYAIIGFDNCLMGNAEIAYELKDEADYLLASEESEPGDGWNYRWLNVFNDRKFRQAEADRQKVLIGKSVINLFSNGIDKSADNSDAAAQYAADVAKSKELWNSTEFTGSTLALIDLSKMSDVRTAANQLGAALNAIYNADHLNQYIGFARTIADLPTMFGGQLGLVDSYILAKGISDEAARQLGTPPGNADITNKLTNIKTAADALITAAGPGVASLDGKGQVGEVGTANDAVVYRALASDYAGGNGLSIFYPGNSNIWQSKLKQVMNNGTQGLYLNDLKFSSENDGNTLQSYAAFVKKLVSETGGTFGFSSDVAITATEVTKSDGHKAVNVKANGDNNKKMVDVECYYSLYEEATHTDYLLGVLPVSYDVNGAIYEIDERRMPTLFFGSITDPDVFTYIARNEDLSSLMIPAYVKLKGEAPIDSEARVPEDKIRYLVVDYNYTKEKWIVTKIWETATASDGSQTIGRLSPDVNTLGSNLEFWPVIASQSNGDLTEYEAVRKQTVPVSAEISLELKGGFLAGMPGYQQIGTFVAYDAYMNAKESNDVTLTVAYDSGNGNSGSRGGGGGGSSSGNTSSSTTTLSNGTRVTEAVTKTGTYTATTTTYKYPDGTTLKEKKVENKDGSGSVTETKIDKEGNTSEVKVVTDTTKTVTEVTTHSENKDKTSVTSVTYTPVDGNKLTLTAYETTGNSVTVPDTISAGGKTYKVTVIGKGAFAGNTAITSMTIGKHVTKISANAFKGARKLKTITIKSKVTAVGKNAFRDINKNATIQIRATKKNYSKIKKAIVKKSGVPSTVKFKRMKGE
ncbi:MAG: leucine-rich repeat protein [Lachnospiraceae bacterium]|nr:leucine-rich repeat protein [Lachnospiraceae bacterium]